MKPQLWSEEVCDTRGLPRPFFILPKEFLEAEQKLGNKSKYPFKRIPIPWQSVPIFGRKDIPSISNPKPGNLGLILNREVRVYDEGLCGYCGVKFKDEDLCIRWTSIKGLQGMHIQSDHLPMHEKCMRQGRVFCPFMQTTEDYEFEKGTYKDLRVNAEPDMQAIPRGAGY